jgi:hypothetical protein
VGQGENVSLNIGEFVRATIVYEAFEALLFPGVYGEVFYTFQSGGWTTG